MTIVSTGSCNGAIASLSCRQGIGTSLDGDITFAGSVSYSFSENDGQTASVSGGITFAGSVTHSKNEQYSLSGTVVFDVTGDGLQSGPADGPDDDGNSRPIDFEPMGPQ